MTAEPAEGASRVPRVRTVVVLPAPLGPEEAEDLAVLDGKGDVRDGRTLTEAFGEAFDKYRVRTHLGAGCCMAHSRLHPFLICCSPRH